MDANLETLGKLALGLIVGLMFLYILVFGLTASGIPAVIIGSVMCAGSLVKADREARWMRRALLAAGLLILLFGVAQLIIL